MSKIEYVLGFLIDHCGYVTLIQKEKPLWQKGKLNGVGGKIEPGETPDQAMEREFSEETGALVPKDRWSMRLIIEGTNWRMFVFLSSVGVRLVNAEPTEPDPSKFFVGSPTEEKVGVYDMANLPAQCHWNLRWMLPLIMDNTFGINWPVYVTATDDKAQKKGV